MCKLCGGSQICFHNNYKSLCKECKGSQLCIHNKRKNNCCLCNFHLYLVNTQRKQINRCFKLSSITKNKHSIEYLGCNIDEFIKFFENKINYYNEFIATDILMTFDNIHIDHIKPVSKFNLNNTDEFYDCCHYTNLQPLLPIENLKKSNKWNKKKEKYWNDNIKGNKNYYEIFI